VINSNLGPISHRFRDMAGFPLNFLPPIHSTPNLKMFPWHYIAEILQAQVSHTWLIICAKKFSPTTKNLATIHPLQMDRQTDRRTTTMPV